MILFFSLAAAIDVRLFAAGHALSQDSRERNAAVLTAQGIAETIRAGSDAGEDGAVFYYDAEWKPADVPADFRAEIQAETEQAAAGELIQYRITVSREEGGELYVLELADYRREGAGA